MSGNLVFLDFGQFSVYWYGVFISLAVLLSAMIFVLLRRTQGAPMSASLQTVLAGMPAALVTSRIFYCWFGKAFFTGNSLWSYIDVTSGGHALYGAFAGILAVLIIDAKRTKQPLTELLDAAAVALSPAVAIGRFAGILSGDDIGFELRTDSLAGMPFVIRSESENAWILWVGFFEGVMAAVMFAVTAAVFLMKYLRRAKGMRRGDTVLCFMLIYGLSQAMLESMRNDSLYMITLGFVRISQIISIVMAVAAIVIISVQTCRIARPRAFHILLWVLSAGALTAATVCEFKMGGDNLSFNYTVMGLSLGFMLISALLGLFYNIRHRSADVSCFPSPSHT